MIEPEFVERFNKTKCPICNSVEGCDHTLKERLRAMEDTVYRDQMRAADPLYQLQKSRAKP